MCPSVRFVRLWITYHRPARLPGPSRSGSAAESNLWFCRDSSVQESAVSINEVSPYVRGHWHAPCNSCPYRWVMPVSRNMRQPQFFRPFVRHVRALYQNESVNIFNFSLPGSENISNFSLPSIYRTFLAIFRRGPRFCKFDLRTMAVNVDGLGMRLADALVCYFCGQFL